MTNIFKSKRWMAAAAVGGAAVMGATTMAIANPPFSIPGKPTNIDPVYGVCRGVDPSCLNDWGFEREDKVLVYSRTAGPRHANLGRSNILDPDDPSNEGIDFGRRPYVITENYTDASEWPVPLDASNSAQLGLIRMLSAEGVHVDVTEDVQAIERLSNSYKAVIFMSPTRDTLWNHAKGAEGGTQLDAARVSLRKYVEGGGGFVGIHNAHGTEYTWEWYEGLLGNSNYYNHGANQDGDVVIVNDNDTSTKDLPQRWGFKDEWYNLVPFPYDVNFLAVVDDTTLAEGTRLPKDSENFHPVTWCQYYDGGRAWITTLGHDGGAFEENSDFPGAEQFQTMLTQGILSAMGNEPFCTPAQGKGHNK